MAKKKPAKKKPAKKPMTPEQFAQNMEQIKQNQDGDPERMHGQMDALMEETLISLGYHKGIATFQKVTKWYA